MKFVIVFAAIVIAASSVFAQPAKTHSAEDEQWYALARVDIHAFAEEVSRDANSDVERAWAIVHFLTRDFDWKATDYQKRTVQQIIDRRGGNCDDLAMVATAAMKSLNIRLRRVHEVHIRTIEKGRGERAAALVKEKGDSYSIFGAHHNDHIWLEVYDDRSKEWLPADPWSGLVGTNEWMRARVGFGPRSGPSPDAREMIVPFAIFAEDADGKFTIDRTRHYLVDEFDRQYNDKLHELPAWSRWVALLDKLAPRAEGAFAGKVNLHEDAAAIDEVATTYEHLRSEYQRSSAPKRTE